MGPAGRTTSSRGGACSPGRGRGGSNGSADRTARSEANKALAKMSLEEKDCIPDTEGACAREGLLVGGMLRMRAAGLSLMEKDILKDWKAKFDQKYTVVGKVKK